MRFEKARRKKKVCSKHPGLRKEKKKADMDKTQMVGYGGIGVIVIFTILMILWATVWNNPSSECANNADCSGETPLCIAKECVGCGVNPSSCPTGTTCSSSGACSTESPSPSPPPPPPPPGALCDPLTKKCPNNGVCINNGTVCAFCSAQLPCIQQDGLCNLKTGKCQPCNIREPDSNAFLQCPTGRRCEVNTGQCVPLLQTS